jgi:predicted PurR-regulated permease PerM
MTQTESQFYPRVFAVVAVDLLGYVSFKVLKPFFEPLMWAGLLAFLLFPISERLLALLEFAEESREKRRTS